MQASANIFLFSEQEQTKKAKIFYMKFEASPKANFSIWVTGLKPRIRQCRPLG